MLNDFFKFDENNADLKTEIFAGLTTFFAMAYILGVNPTILGDAGMSQSGVFFATAFVSAISSIMLGLFSKYPMAIAPGMGYNALFSYTIVLSMGKSWQAALAAVFISSIVFLFINFSGLRDKIINIIPIDIKLGIGASIGLFLALVGLQRCGIMINNEFTLIAMENLLDPHALLAAIGILIALIFYVKKVNISIFLALIITSILGLIFSIFGFGAGDALMPVIPNEIITTNIDFSLAFAFTDGFLELFSDISGLIMIIFSIVFITLFDTIGCVIPLVKECGFSDDEKQAPKIERSFLSVSFAGIIAAICGSSTPVVYLESTAGIGTGGRTGLTAIVVGICFFLSIFFAPLILSVFTSPVTVSALVIVGISMITQLKDVNWDDYVVVASVFMTILMSLLSFSISIGIAWGFVTYVISSLAASKFKEINWGMGLLAIVFLIYLLFGL